MLRWVVKLHSSGHFFPVSNTEVLCPPRNVADSLTEEFPGVSHGEGKPQDRAQHHVQPEFPPLDDELGAVCLGEEKGDDMEATSWMTSRLLQGVHQALAWPRRQQQAAVLEGRGRGACECLPLEHGARSWKGPSLAIPTPGTAFLVLGSSNVGHLGTSTVGNQ